MRVSKLVKVEARYRNGSVFRSLLAVLSSILKRKSSTLGGYVSSRGQSGMVTTWHHVQTVLTNNNTEWGNNLHHNYETSVRVFWYRHNNLCECTPANRRVSRRRPGVGGSLWYLLLCQVPCTEFSDLGSPVRDSRVFHLLVRPVHSTHAHFFGSLKYILEYGYDGCCARLLFHFRKVFF